MKEVEGSACSLAAHAARIKKEKAEEEGRRTFGKVATSEQTGEIGQGGSFVRQQNRFTTPFGEGEGELPVEAGRYRLIWTPLCPWATRQRIVLRLLGIGENVISVGTVAPVRTESGWEFSLDEGGKDPVLGIRFLPEIYAKTDPEYSGRATVPAIVDVKEGKVVNNDYHRLTNYWETVWKPFWKKDAPDLYPLELRTGIDALNEILFNEINNGVYKAGFAQTVYADEAGSGHDHLPCAGFILFMQGDPGRGVFINRHHEKLLCFLLFRQGRRPFRRGFRLQADHFPGRQQGGAFRVNGRQGAEQAQCHNERNHFFHGTFSPLCLQDFRWRFAME